MYENHFWQGNHRLSNVNEKLTEKLVPDSGEAQTPHGELLRCMNKLYSDVYNNGFGNGAVLKDRIATVKAHKADIVPFLRDKGSWTANLYGLLRKVGRQDRQDGEFVRQLEDITEAVVKYVASKELAPV